MHATLNKKYLGTPCAQLSHNNSVLCEAINTKIIKSMFLQTTIGQQYFLFKGIQENETGKC